MGRVAFSEKSAKGGGTCKEEEVWGPHRETESQSWVEVLRITSFRRAVYLVGNSLPG